VAPQASRTVALSAVVVVLEGTRSLPRCLTALTQQEGVSGIEIIVPYDDRTRQVTTLETRFPAVHFVRVEGQRTYAELRAIGIRHARGAIVAITEDHCTPRADWGAQLLAAHAHHGAVIGGAIDKQTPDTALNWALYLADFVRYMHPLTEGPSHSLSDCNVSYKRVALEAIADVWTEEFHEPLVHAALQGRGEVLWLTPRVVVLQQRTLALGAALWDRYAFGRLFSSTRVTTFSWQRRCLYATLTPLLLPLLVARVAGHIRRTRRYVREFLYALPHLTLLTIAWAWGEGLGALTGRPPPALRAAARHRAGRSQHDQIVTT
jgi:hypothetical protein